MPAPAVAAESILGHLGSPALVALGYIHTVCCALLAFMAGREPEGAAMMVAKAGTMAAPMSPVVHHQPAAMEMGYSGHMSPVGQRHSGNVAPVYMQQRY